jgi:hypothetical protein
VIETTGCKKAADQRIAIAWGDWPG